MLNFDPFYFFLFFGSCVLAPVLAICRLNKSDKLIFYFVVFCILGIFAGLRAEGVDVLDYLNYKNLFIQAVEVPFHGVYATDVDLSYWVFSNLMWAIAGQDGFYLLIFTFAVSSLLIKYASISYLNYDHGIFLISLLSSYLYLHGFVQIRSGLAVALLGLVSAALAKGQLRFALLLFVFSILSHASAIFAGLLFLLRVDFKYKASLFNIILFATPFFVSKNYNEIVGGLYVISGSISQLELSKASYLQVDQNMDLFPPLVVFNIALYVLLSMLVFRRGSKYGYFYLHAFGLGLLFYWLTSFSSVFAYRLLEMFSVFFVFAVSSIKLKAQFKYLIIVGQSSVLFYLYLIRDPIVEGYKLIGF